MGIFFEEGFFEEGGRRREEGEWCYELPSYCEATVAGR
jgi:hypothetical protein